MTLTISCFTSKCTFSDFWPRSHRIVATNYSSYCYKFVTTSKFKKGKITFLDLLFLTYSLAEL